MCFFKYFLIYILINTPFSILYLFYYLRYFIEGFLIVYVFKFGTYYYDSCICLYIFVL
jgi:hypothetical protein